MASASNSGMEPPVHKRDGPSSRSVLSTVATAMFVGSLLVVCVLCAAGLYLFQPDVHDDPEAVEPLMAEILQITVPPEFEPRGTIEWNVAFMMTMRGAYYEMPAAESEGMLIFVEVQSSMQSPDVEAHIRQALREKGGGVRELELVGETEQQELQVGDELVPFAFETYRDPATDHTYRVIKGVVDGENADRGAHVLIAVSVREQWSRDESAVEWDDEIFRHMIESIR